MKLSLRRAPHLLLAVALFVVVGAGMAAAAPKLIEPSANPYKVQVLSNGKLAPITISASGFQPGQQVYVEQCDGNPDTAPNWTPSIDCDIGTSPAPVFTPASGTVVFDTSDLNHRFTPVKGLSPEGNFACFTSTSPSGVPHFNTCQVRISTNNTQATTDQIFLELTMAGQAGTTGSAAAASSSSSSSSTVVFVVLGVVVVVLLGGALLLRSRRAAQPRRAATTARR